MTKMTMTLHDKDDEQHRQQPKRIKTLHSSGTSKDPQSVPPDIIIEILSRLPVKSLLRISFSTSNNRYAHRHLIFSTKSISVHSCPLYDVLYDGIVNALEIDYPLKESFDYVRIFGCCNGLFLIANKVDDLFIWNPSTRRSNRLPCSGSRGRPRKYEFGYDESSDDYKVVAIYYVYKGEAVYNAIVKIYSLKTGNWKRIGDFHNGFSMDCCVKYLNGVLHWTSIQDSGSSYSWTIVSLDLAKETYGEILQPACDEGDMDLKLGALREWLCVLCDHYGRNCADVWVMKVYGVKDSWTKLVSIPYPIDRECFGFSVPLCISNDGKVLLQHGSELVVYDSENCSFSEIQNFNEWAQAYTIAESLVSPDSRALEITIRLDIKENGKRVTGFDMASPASAILAGAAAVTAGT
ncbi:unnamed protein product [Lactuca virosa]|uniref:F-box domain-containing protein n=1 Tax=Lactuca virosa TaxID=75947 RepID=A0AAU9ND17_9ASTR|nr:unnamed protein product [Lactuca virosa]